MSTQFQEVMRYSKLLSQSYVSANEDVCIFSLKQTVEKVSIIADSIVSQPGFTNEKLIDAAESLFDVKRFIDKDFHKVAVLSLNLDGKVNNDVYMACIDALDIIANKLEKSRQAIALFAPMCSFDQLFKATNVGQVYTYADKKPVDKNFEKKQFELLELSMKLSEDIRKYYKLAEGQDFALIDAVACNIQGWVNLKQGDFTTKASEEYIALVNMLEEASYILESFASKLESRVYDDLQDATYFDNAFKQFLELYNKVLLLAKQYQDVIPDYEVEFYDYTDLADNNHDF